MFHCVFYFYLHICCLLFILYKTDCLIKYVNTTLRCENLLILLSAKTGLKPIGPIALNWTNCVQLVPALELSTLGCSRNVSCKFDIYVFIILSWL